jgi:hypothetical protein
VQRSIRAQVGAAHLEAKVASRVADHVVLISGKEIVQARFGDNCIRNIEGLAVVNNRADDLVPAIESIRRAFENNAVPPGRF